MDFYKNMYKKLVCWLCGLLLGFLATPAFAKQLLVITAAPVQAGKFAVLNGFAAPQGWQVRPVFAERLTGEEGAALFKGADLVLLDIPYDQTLEMVERKVGSHLKASGLPWLKVQEKKHSALGIAGNDAAALWSYYNNGGKRNFANFFKYLDAVTQKRSTQAIAQPIIFPDTGIYHPDSEQLFTDTASYLAWKKHDESDRRPVIGFSIHKMYLSADLTDFIDTMIRRIEAKGGIALTFYGPMDDALSYTRVLAPAGKPLVDVIVSSQIMLHPEPRRAEFEKMGVPVIQAMPYRRGDVNEWRADPAGVHLMDVPFYLAQPEYAGVAEAVSAAAVRKGDGQVVAIPEQVEWVADRAMKLAQLRHTRNADKRVVVFYWNYPPGETNLGASYLNLPRSLAATLKAMQGRGYAVETPQAEAMIAPMQRLLQPYYREIGYDALLKDNLADKFMVSDYKAWFDKLPAATRSRIVARWGEPETSPMVVGKGKNAYFPVPRYQLGNVIIMPQPPRGDGEKNKEKALYHDTKSPVNHHYLAVYLWARQQYKAHVLVHYGTHGSQEWMPGKERGLSAYDDAVLPLGDLPVVYPYIVDDVGEAVQAKRRGQAVIVSHQTPPFSPAGLHGEMMDLHHLVHEWQNLTEGAVRDKTAESIIRDAARLNFDKDTGLSPAQIKADFPRYLTRLHDWLHELAQANQPQGMHTLGKSPEDRYRIGMVMQMLGTSYADNSWRFAKKHPDYLLCSSAEADCRSARMEVDEADEVFVTDYRDIDRSIPFRLLKRYLQNEQPLPADTDKSLLQQLEQAKAWYAALDASPEMTGLLNALEGQYIPTAYGGDAIRNPDSLPTGRNLYSFDPSKVPTKAAFEAAKDATDKLINAYREKNGHLPSKLAFTLWSVETMRHYGVLEAQAFLAMGVRPKWDAGGRVVGVELIPREELKRPRIDVVLSATGLYRDHFPNVMRWLAEAAALAAKAEEPDNAVRATSQKLKSQLLQQGLPPTDAEKWANVRIFSNESGEYGSGIEDAILASDTWTHEQKVAKVYLSRLQYAYGTDMGDWGKKLDGINLFAENLKGVQAAALSRTSNLYGMLTTDDPFQYLGGISLAVRSLTGKSPELYISNLREADNPKAETAAQFLARELRTRQFHPGWIEGLKKEGYSGTTEMLDAINNFWGWQVTAPDIVRHDQWQEFVEVYVRDKHKLGMQAYFEEVNPAALAQMMERMLEAARKGYWKTDEATLNELASRYRDLAIRRDVRTDNQAFEKYVKTLTATTAAAGFGLARPLSGAAPDSAPAKPEQQAETKAEPTEQATPPEPVVPPPIQGMRLEKVSAPAPVPPLSWIPMLGLLLVTGAGAWVQRR